MLSRDTGKLLQENTVFAVTVLVCYKIWTTTASAPLDRTLDSEALRFPGPQDAP